MQSQVLHHTDMEIIWSNSRGKMCSLSEPASLQDSLFSRCISTGGLPDAKGHAQHPVLGMSWVCQY